MTDLSGRVDALESLTSFHTQDLLLKIGIDAASEQATNWNSQFDALDTTLQSIKSQLASLQTLYTNLYLTVQNNWIAFTGYTGSV